MEKKAQIYEGKAKKVYETDDPSLLIVDYKDDATAFNGLKKGTIVGKGIIQPYEQFPHADSGGEGDPHPLCAGTE